MDADIGNFVSVRALRTWAQGLPQPREDIALALKVIGRRTPAQIRVEATWPDPPNDRTIHPADPPCPALPDATGDAPLSAEALQAFQEDLKDWKNAFSAYPGYRLDLRDTNLQRADMNEGNFTCSLFDGARMDGASLRHARLAGADLWKVWMAGAELRFAGMEGVNLHQAQMEGSDISAARMVGADIGLARMEGADLWQARMEGANLWRAQMVWANLGQARMEGANLRYAQMEWADLWQVGMDQTTSLENASFFCATWREVDLRDVRLSPEQVSASFGDASVILPDTLEWPAHWPTWELPEDFESDGPTYASELARWRTNPASYTPPQPQKPRDTSGQTLPKP